MSEDVMSLQTPDQYWIKLQAGWLPWGHKARWIWHWRFWDPVECVGGKVYFGPYYEIRWRRGP